MLISYKNKENISSLSNVSLQNFNTEKPVASSYFNSPFLDKSFPRDIFSAIKCRDIGAVKFLLNTESKMNEIDFNGDSLLHCAVLSGEIKIVVLVINAGAKINIQNKKSLKTPLHMACENGLTEIVRLFLEINALGEFVDKNLLDKYNNTAFHLAIRHSHKEIIRDFALSGLNLNIKHDNKVTFLIWAIQKNCTREIIKTLIEEGADVNTSDINGRPPLYWAFQNGRHDIARFLIEAGAFVNLKNVYGERLLYCVLKNPELKFDKNIIEIFTNAKVDFNFKIRINADRKISFIEWLIRNKKIESVQQVIKYGARTDIDIVESFEKNGILIITNTPFIQWIVNAGHASLLTTVLIAADKFNYKIDHTTPLIWAFKNNYNEIILEIIKNREDIDALDENGFTLLQWAILTEQLKFIKPIIKAGANVNVKINYTTPLLWAIQNNFLDIAQLLIHNGADIHALDEESYSALHILCAKVDDKSLEEDIELSIDSYLGNRHKIIELLSEPGYLSVAVIKKFGNNLLMWAVQNNHVDVAELLIDGGVQVNFISTEYGTPLSLAVEKNSGEMVELLLKAGAEASISKDGKLLLQYAISKNHTKSINALIKFGWYSPDQSLNKNLSKPVPKTLIESNGLDIIRYLIEQRVDLNAENYNDHTPLNLACKNMNFKVIKLLVESGVSIDNKSLNIVNRGVHLKIKNSLEIRNFLLHAKHSARKRSQKGGVI